MRERLTEEPNLKEPVLCDHAQTTEKQTQSDFIVSNRVSSVFIRVHPWFQGIR
jgi:hypothetical protein